MPLLALRGRAGELYVSLLGANGRRVSVLLSAARVVREGEVRTDCVFLATGQRDQLERELVAAARAAEEAFWAKDAALIDVERARARVRYANRVSAGRSRASGRPARVGAGAGPGVLSVVTGNRRQMPKQYAELPDGTVVVAPDGRCQLVVGDRLLCFSFDGWLDATPRPPAGEAAVLTPPTSVAALAHGYRPLLHPSARAGCDERAVEPPRAGSRRRSRERSRR